MGEFIVAQIPSDWAVKRNFQHSKLKPYAVILNLFTLGVCTMSDANGNILITEEI